jgi:3-oxoacyl-[acyl-carrier-protein] synthase II
MEAVTGLGNNLETTWDGLIEGKSSVRDLSEYLYDWCRSRIGCKPKGWKLGPNILTEKDEEISDIVALYAIDAAARTWRFHEWENNNLYNYDPHRIGVILGNGSGGMASARKIHQRMQEKLGAKIGPYLLVGYLGNCIAGKVSILLGAKGINYTLQSACASGTHAIQMAYNEIAYGKQDVMITGGCESTIYDECLDPFYNGKAITNSNDPETQPRPFDKNRSGFVAGEGSGILILEEYEAAKARGATIYAEIVGQGATADAYHIIIPDKEGHGLAKCMEIALEDANISPDDIGYINAHGTATKRGDVAESLAIQKVFGDYKVPISSTKGAIGHLLGGAGGIEAIFSIMALYKGILPPTLNCDDPGFDLDIVRYKGREADIEYSMSNSAGFGGSNGVLIFKKV